MEPQSHHQSIPALSTLKYDSKDYCEIKTPCFMIKLKPYSESILASGGFLLVVMGIYFVLLRPSLLPEDLKYIQTTSAIVQENLPQLTIWLHKVFWVMGSYIFTTGLLTIFIALTSFRKKTTGAFSIVLISGITSIGFMTIANFLIGSDFKWLLLFFSLPWTTALILYRFHK